MIDEPGELAVTTERKPDPSSCSPGLLRAELDSDNCPPNFVWELEDNEEGAAIVGYEIDGNKSIIWIRTGSAPGNGKLKIIARHPTVASIRRSASATVPDNGGDTGRRNDGTASGGGCTSCGPVGEADFQLDGVDARFDLGTDGDGNDLGSLRLDVEDPNLAFFDHYLLSVLTGHNDDIRVLWEAARIRQILTERYLIDIDPQYQQDPQYHLDPAVELSDYLTQTGYVIRYFETEDVPGLGDGLARPALLSGSWSTPVVINPAVVKPFLEWEIVPHEDSTSTDVVTIVKRPIAADGSVITGSVQQYSYSYESLGLSHYAWELAVRDDAGLLVRVEREEWSPIVSSSDFQRIYTVDLYESGVFQGEVRRVVERYGQLNGRPDRSKLVERQEATGVVGVSESTSRTYYVHPSPHAGQLALEVLPSGSWTAYQFADPFAVHIEDSNGVLGSFSVDDEYGTLIVLRGLKDTAPPSLADIESGVIGESSPNVEATVTEYYFDDGTSPLTPLDIRFGQPKSIKRYRAGVLIESREFHHSSFTPSEGDYAHIELASSRTSITYTPSNESETRLKTWQRSSWQLLKRYEGADGEYADFSYQSGTVNTSTGAFSPSPDGPDTHIRARQGVWNGNFAVFPDSRSFITETVRTGDGLYQRTSRYVITTAAPDGMLIGWQETEFDERGRVVATEDHRGVTTSNVWSETSCCTKVIRTTADGQQIEERFDDLGRLVERIIVGNASVPLLATITQTYTYGVETCPGGTGDCFVVTETTASSLAAGETLVSKTFTDLAGRPAGTRRLVPTAADPGYELVTSYAYGATPEGGEIITVTDEYGGVHITEFQRDGRPRLVSGNVIPMAYAYTYSGGHEQRSVVTGPDALSGAINPARETITTFDELGRRIIVDEPGFDESGAGAALRHRTYYDYEPASQRVKRIRPDDGPHTLNVYDPDAPTVLLETGLNADQNVLKVNLEDGEDRYTRTETRYVEIGAVPYRRTSTWVAEGGETNVKLRPADRTTEVRVGSLTGGVIAWQRVIDRAGRETVSETTFDGTTRHQTTTFTGFDSATNTAQQITTLGRLVSTRSKVGNETRYEYDAFNRQDVMIDSLTELRTESIFDAAGRVIEQREIALGTTVGEVQWARFLSYASAGGPGRLNRLSTIEQHDFDSSGAPIGTRTTRMAYNERGQVTQTWGDMPYPTEVEYDAYGNRSKLKTYRAGDAATWSAASWPGNPSLLESVTEWSFDPATNLLTQKTYGSASGTPKATDYTYTLGGRLATRTWAREDDATSTRLSTTYDYYDADDVTGLGFTGDLKSVTYNSAANTPPVSYIYDRRGRLASATDGQGVTTTTYDPATGIPTTTRTINGGPAVVITPTISTTAPIREEGYAVNLAGTTEIDLEYEFDPDSGLLSAIYETTPDLLPGGRVRYDYRDNVSADVTSATVTKATYGDGTSDYFSHERVFEQNRNLVAQVRNSWLGGGSAVGVSQFDRDFDRSGRLIEQERTGQAYAASDSATIGYNNRDELTSFDWNATPSVDNTYIYDPIGNRQASTGGTGNWTYESNVFNQYHRRFDSGGGASISQSFLHDDDGNLVQEFATADVNNDGLTNTSDVDPFIYAVLNDRAAFDLMYPDGNYDAADINGDGFVNTTDIDPFTAVVLDNITFAGILRAFEYDGENRLIKVTPSSPVLGDEKVAFRYDYLGRRVYKAVYAYIDADPGPGVMLQWSGSPTRERHFVYHGWRPVLELDGAHDVVRRYVWGLDLSSTPEGAGGIGGLLAIDQEEVGIAGQPGHVPAGKYLPAYDALGNIVQLIAWESGYAGASGYAWTADRMVAKYEYDPYGNVTAQAGAYAAENPWRWSTKYWDVETGLGYWGYRFYDPRTGRWINRDPIEEVGSLVMRTAESPRHVLNTIPQHQSAPDASRSLGMVVVDDNLYGLVVNQPLRFIDPLGLCRCAVSIQQAELVPHLLINFKQTGCNENFSGTAEWGPCGFAGSCPCGRLVVDGKVTEEFGGCISGSGPAEGPRPGGRTIGQQSFDLCDKAKCNPCECLKNNLGRRYPVYVLSGPNSNSAVQQIAWECGIDVSWISGYPGWGVPHGSPTNTGDTAGCS